MVLQNNCTYIGQQDGQGSGDPPKSLEELASLFADIKSSSAQLKIGSSKLWVLSGMLYSPNQSIFYSISHLAKTFDVNPSILTRLAETLVFSSFSEHI